MIINLSHANSLGKLLFNSNSINKKDFLAKLKNYGAKGVILAHLINFKMYCASKSNNIEKQNSELKHIQDMLRRSYNKEIIFDDVQKFVHDKSTLLQQQLPSQFKEAILELVNSKNDGNYYDFVRHLSGDSYSFLQMKGINISTVIISSVEYLSDITCKGHVHSHDEALAMLEKFGNQLNINVCNALVLTLIENCSGINSLNDARQASTALKALEKFGDQLEDNFLHSLVITLIENCSGINSNGYIRRSYIAIQALNKYAS